MSDAPELKPCPFCGSEAEFIGGLPKSGYDRVSCTRCFAEVDGDDKGKAIAAWNTRAALREIEELKAKLAKALEALEEAWFMLTVQILNYEPAPEDPGLRRIKSTLAELTGGQDE